MVRRLSSSHLAPVIHVEVECNIVTKTEAIVSIALSSSCQLVSRGTHNCNRNRTPHRTAAIQPFQIAQNTLLAALAAPSIARGAMHCTRGHGHCIAKQAHGFRCLTTVIWTKCMYDPEVYYSNTNIYIATAASLFAPTGNSLYTCME